MKKLFFFLFFLVLSPVALAQSYSDYLQAAKRHLKNGNVEKARLTYNIYKDLTGKKDAYIEGQLNPAKAAKDLVASSSKTQASSASTAPPQDKHTSSTSRTFTVNGVSFQMVYVQGGTFRMGSNDSEAGDEEQPVHSVTLSDYYIGETEVTQQLWRAVMGSNPSYFTGNSLRPVEQVSWDECQTFIRKLNALTGKNFRLPTEAEWEYAARGGNKSRGYKYSGSNTLSDVAWYEDNASSTTHPVKQKRSNELGLYDMSGNVWEWCQDWYSSNYYSQSPSYNPTGPSPGSYRVDRGGSWYGHARCCRVADRDNCNPDYRINCLGLRLALTPSKETSTSSVSKDKAPFAQQGQSVPTSRTFTVNGVSFQMVYVQGGTFRMGSNDSEADDDEQPVHSVTLSDYYIGETEVTQQLWHAVMGSNPSYFTGDSQRSVEQVSWDDCQTFIRKLNALTGKNFRLPTEAEWEYAARGGNKSRGYKYSGSNTLSDVAWYDDKASDTTHPVKQKRSNELGLYDMSGNVYEWCQDYYGDDYYSQSPSYNPTGPSSGWSRVCRGGGWNDHACGYCVANRGDYYPDDRYSTLGLRLALTPCKETSTSSVSKDKAPFAQQGQSVPTSRTFTVNGVSFWMVYVQGGTFRMGSNDSDAESYEQPVHSVTLSDYYIGETEVTQQLWHAVMGSNPSYFNGDSQRPVDGVSWEDCQTFIRKLNALTGKDFRLPTEAEWEYAARGGNKSRGYKYSGSNTLSDVAWYDDNASDTTHPVKQKRSNELGLYDMSGNVYEWCQDWYDSDYYSQSPSYNPTGPSSGSRRVIRGGRWSGLNRVFRGGSWFDYAWYCRVAYRYGRNPGYRNYYLGLRLAL